MNLVDKATKSSLKDDIHTLQACQSPEIFEKASSLFLLKWEKVEPAFIKYFKKMWLCSKRSGWYQGYASAIPDHNNSNESDNRYIKEDQDRKRLGLIQFLNHAANSLVHEWSLRRRADSYTYVPFHTYPQLQLSHWTNSWQWSSLCKQILRYKKGIYDFWCIPAGLEKAISQRDCTKYFTIIEDKSWGSFDNYASHIRTIHYIKYEKKDWLKSKCSFEYWAKNYHCHHTVGLAVYKKKAAYLDIHMEIPIGQTRARGQPKKTASALNKQDGDGKISSDSSSSDSTDDSDPSPVKKVVKKKTTNKSLPKKRGRKPKQ